VTERFDVPGIGTLHFEVKDNTDHNPYDGDGQAFQWIATGDHDGRRKYDAGTTIMDNCYSLDHWDGSSVWCVRFDKKAGSRIEDRRDYWQAQGYAKQDAWVKARASIIRECRYWRSVAKGDTSFVGLIVKLVAPEDTGMNDAVMEEESCWGFEYEREDSYLLETMNGWAQDMVEKHWKKLYGKPPNTFVAGSNPIVDAAWQAWHTAMVTCDEDRDIADPIFVSTIKGETNARRILSSRRLQARAVAR
jgi:hypothetical protein